MNCLVTLLAAEVFEGSKIVTVSAGDYHTMAVGVNGSLWAWGLGSYGQLGLGDTNKRLVPTLVGAEEMFGGSKVRTVACGDAHTLAVTEAGELWAWGLGVQGRLGLNDEQRRLMLTRVDPQHFAHAPICAVAAGESHSAAVTAGGALYYTWGKGEAGNSPGSQVPGGLGRPCKKARADAGAAAAAGRGAHVAVPRAARGARAGLRHGDARAAGRELRGGRSSRGKEAVAAGAGQGTGDGARGGGMTVPDDAGGSGEAGGGGGRVDSGAEGELGEGVVRLMGGGGREWRFETRGIVHGGAWKDRWRKMP
jgi:hypothetical protein